MFLLICSWTQNYFFNHTSFEYLVYFLVKYKMLPILFVMYEDCYLALICALQSDNSCNILCLNLATVVN